MKRLIMLAAVATLAAFIPGQTRASGLLLNLNVSGTVEVWTNVDAWLANSAPTNKTETGIASSSTMSFNNKYIYNLISNAVANAYGDMGTNLTPTNLPTSSYIAFNVNGVDNPGYPDSGGSGTFYVTNSKTHFYLPLSGYDKQTNYYSFIELDDNDFDFYDNFVAASKGSINYKTLKGSYTDNEPSVFYVHDNPYAYDDGDNPGVIFSTNNYMAIEIRSNIKAIWGFTNWDNSNETGIPVSQSDVSTSGGCGNAIIKGNLYSAVTSGKVSLIP